MASHCAREYGWSFEYYLAQEATRVNAFFAASCENAGLVGVDTYLTKEYQEHIEEIKAGTITL